MAPWDGAPGSCLGLGPGWAVRPCDVVVRVRPLGSDRCSVPSELCDHLELAQASPAQRPAGGLVSGWEAPALQWLSWCRGPESLHGRAGAAASWRSGVGPPEPMGRGELGSLQEEMGLELGREFSLPRLPAEGLTVWTVEADAWLTSQPPASVSSSVKCRHVPPL